MQNNNFRAVSALFLTIIFWGSAFPGIRVALLSFQPESLALGRFLVASLCFTILNIILRNGWPQTKHLPQIFFCGLCGVTIYHLALNFGETTVSAGVASVIIATGPMFIALTARFFLKEHLTWITYLGIMVAFFGTIVLANLDFADLSADKGALLVLVAAIATAGYTVGQKPLLKYYKALPLTGWMLMAGTILLLPFMANLWHDLQQATQPAITAVIYLGIFPSATAYALWSYALNHSTATKASVVLYLSPLAAYIIAWRWLGEIPSRMEIVGSIIIIIGVIIVNTSRQQVKKR